MDQQLEKIERARSTELFQDICIQIVESIDTEIKLSISADYLRHGLSAIQQTEVYFLLVGTDGVSSCYMERLRKMKGNT